MDESHSENLLIDLERDIGSEDEYYTDEDRRSASSIKRKANGDSSICNKRQRLRQQQRYRKEWEKDKDLKDWLAPYDKDSTKAKCRYCVHILAAHLAGLKKHATTPKHEKAVEAAKKAVEATKPLTHYGISDEQKIAEMNIAAYIASSGIAFRQVDNLVDLIKSVVKKDGVAKNIKLGRTKCTKVVLRVLGPGFWKLILEDVGNEPYSLLIDESTDVSTCTLPMLCLVLRYLSWSQQKIIMTFYQLIRLRGKSAKEITNAILAALKEDSLDVKKMVSLGTDGANTLVGHRSGVIARLQEHNPQ